MAERRSNYTGAAHEEVIRRAIEAKENRPEFKPTPMMVIADISRIACGIVEDGSPTQFMQNSSRHILRVLSHSSGICQLDLARETRLKPPTISVTLSKLEKEGLVTRVIDGTDGRATRVYLTDKGIAINEQIWERIMDIDNAAIEGLTAEERETLMDILGKMRKNLVKISENK